MRREQLKEWLIEVAPPLIIALLSLGISLLLVLLFDWTAKWKHL
ncbi:MAG TPA: hypothetical protein VET48_04935 [Steroidobacteraceae bacterium]|nr:hypothetical protein [Steroidobacteraceae bacterium]